MHILFGENILHYNISSVTIFCSSLFCECILSLEGDEEQNIFEKYSGYFLQLPLFANYKNLTKEKVYDVLKVFVSSVSVGGSTVYVAFLMICFLS